MCQVVNNPKPLIYLAFSGVNVKRDDHIGSMEIWPQTFPSPPPFLWPLVGQAGSRRWGEVSACGTPAPCHELGRQKFKRGNCDNDAGQTGEIRPIVFHGVDDYADGGRCFHKVVFVG